ncbi:MAG: hypothetical protein R2824_03360 [Saprospiraceae bacterium]
MFTSFYLLAFGFSSLVLNHKIPVDQKAVVDTWSGQVQIDPGIPDQEIAEGIRDQLGLMGWIPPWQFKKDSTQFRCVLTHLAKDTELKLDLRTGIVQVAEMPKGFWAVLHGLHFFNGNIPNAPSWFRTWAVYQWLTLFVLMASLLLGLWLWLKYSRKAWEVYLFGGLFFISCLIMLLL